MTLDLDHHFPRLAGSGYEITEEATDNYNCIAWALGISSGKWDCFDPDAHWPPSLPRDHWIWTILRLFADEGFEVCENDTLEAGFERIAIFAFVGQFTHVARQLDNGQWTSKLGNRETITHPSPANLIGGFYGDIHCIMRRPANES